MTKAITPFEAGIRQVSEIPDQVFEAFNELIVENLRYGLAIVSQDGVVALIVSKMGLEDDNQIYRKGWLNVEKAYRDAGWNVKYDKPGYNESGSAYYEFRAKEKS